MSNKKYYRPPVKRQTPSMPKMPWDDDNEKSKAEKQQTEAPSDGDDEERENDRERNPKTGRTDQDKRRR